MNAQKFLQFFSFFLFFSFFYGFVTTSALFKSEEGLDLLSDCLIDTVLVQLGLWSSQSAQKSWKFCTLHERILSIS